MQPEPMRPTIFATVATCWLAVGCAAHTRSPAPELRPPILYQYSVIDALLAGVFDGGLTVEALRRHGDFGIGAFNALDGEMVLVDGVSYRIRFDGSVHTVPDSERMPIGFVTWFRPTRTFTLTRASSLGEVQADLARQLRANRPYAIELRGRFTRVRARAPEPATPPYPELNAHLAGHQHEFPLVSTEGVAVGFLLPAYLAHVNVTGLHLHYLASDHRSGGHILDLEIDGPVTVRALELTGVDIELSDDPAFDRADLTRDRQRELRQIEQAPGERQ
jgi:acetolactate decarboxylase